LTRINTTSHNRAMTVAEIIIRLGGAPAIAQSLGLPAGDVGAKRVRAWASRRSIPAEYWAGIAAFSKEGRKGITLEVLAAAHAAPVAEAA
jgi:hypothetical protein